VTSAVFAALAAAIAAVMSVMFCALIVFSDTRHDRVSASSVPDGERVIARQKRLPRRDTIRKAICVMPSCRDQ
jgi:hypothetical protein